jgi:hypothetical protein
MRHALAVALCALLAGCGNESDSENTAAKNDGPPPSHSGEQAEIAGVAERYLSAFSDEDWATVCETRSKKDRDAMAQLAGSCERAFEAVAKSKPGATEFFADARAGEVRIRGDRADVDILQPGQTKAAMALVAVKRDGAWLLEDVPEDDAKP